MNNEAITVKLQLNNMQLANIAQYAVEIGATFDNAVQDLVAEGLQQRMLALAGSEVNQ